MDTKNRVRKFRRRFVPAYCDRDQQFAYKKVSRRVKKSIDLFDSELSEEIGKDESEKDSEGTNEIASSKIDYKDSNQNIETPINDYEEDHMIDEIKGDDHDNDNSFQSFPKRKTSDISNLHHGTGDEESHPLPPNFWQKVKSFTESQVPLMCKLFMKHESSIEKLIAAYIHVSAVVAHKAIKKYCDRWLEGNPPNEQEYMGETKSTSNRINKLFNWLNKKLKQWARLHDRDEVVENEIEEVDEKQRDFAFYPRKLNLILFPPVGTELDEVLESLPEEEEEEDKKGLRMSAEGLRKMFWKKGKRKILNRDFIESSDLPLIVILPESGNSALKSKRECIDGKDCQHDVSATMSGEEAINQLNNLAIHMNKFDTSNSHVMNKVSDLPNTFPGLLKGQQGEIKDPSAKFSPESPINMNPTSIPTETDNNFEFFKKLPSQQQPNSKNDLANMSYEDFQNIKALLNKQMKPLPTIPQFVSYGHESQSTEGPDKTMEEQLYLLRQHTTEKPMKTLDALDNDSPFEYVTHHKGGLILSLSLSLFFVLCILAYLCYRKIKDKYKYDYESDLESSRVRESSVRPRRSSVRNIDVSLDEESDANGSNSSVGAYPLKEAGDRQSRRKSYLEDSRRNRISIKKKSKKSSTGPFQKSEKDDCVLIDVGEKWRNSGAWAPP